MKIPMNSLSDVRVLLPEDKDKVIAFAKGRLAALVQDPMDCELQSWTAPWRGEALDHYLKQGWSYGLFSGPEIQGYLIAQPLLFFRGLTQTLWVEKVDALSPEGVFSLIDVAYGWARDKHFQCVLAQDQDEFREQFSRWPKAKILDSRWIEIKSAKL